MASIRGISKKVTLLPRRLHPSFAHILHGDSDEAKSHPSNLSSSFQKVIPCRSYVGSSGMVSLPQGKHCSSVGFGFLFSRYMSSKPEDWSDKVDSTGFVADEFVPEKIVEAATNLVPAVNEVAVAAADSSIPVAALQYLIDGVHSFTGLNWWASIALTTLMIRGLTVPLLLSQLKATSKLNMLRPRLEELKQEISSRSMDPEAMAEGQKQMQALFKEHGVNPFTPLKGILIQGPIFISFFLAIRNMAEKVPSFQNGGTLWFTDLSTPDSLYILPVLTALTFLITVECNMQEGLEGNPIAGTMKKFSRILAFVSVPVMISFEKALFCYWLTSNLFSLTYGLVLKRPEVKKLLNLPEAPTSTNNQTSQPSQLPFSPLKNEDTVQEKPDVSSGTSEANERKISRHSVLSQRIRSLEKQVKDKKKSSK